ncbi:hypothetical protein A3H86_01510 [Candidatus Roizmanbacteria bacterium RIFCSPLOWO2_02_FULL_41_9]|uniref:DUF916 domain-containing protein n=1 Tax=Candidatus Roizmanbacteria bacterium RIFCSPLOWO2_02_FULL_41_9 TaxID=1802077 RepID=A0A1F7JRU2_9BACT|nr:MAG: hypothetical protein A3H86_01510 [Candidatus Roizmanbacteria bacterium RIFCSPLOWO2_02_FULL_41_9]
MKKLFILSLFFYVNSMIFGFRNIAAQTITPALTDSPPRITLTLTPTPDLSNPSAPKSGINITVSPYFINLKTDPGVPVSYEFSVKNNNAFDEFLKLTILKFDASSSGDTPEIKDLGPDDTFAQWMTFSESRFQALALKEHKVKFTISPPKSAAFGYYYSIVVNRINPGAGFGESGASLNGGAAVSVFLEVVSGEMHRELKLVSFLTSLPIYEYLPTVFDIKLKNVGNIHSVPAGDIFIDQLGVKKEIATIIANPNRGNILPGTTRTYHAFWDDGMIVRSKKMANGQELRDKYGNIIYETKVDLTKANKFRIGKYTAHLFMIYDDGKKDVPMEATVSFWVIPWKILIAALIVILTLLYGVRSMVVGVVSLFKKRKP